MRTFGDDLIQAMTEALAHAKGEGFAVVHSPKPQVNNMNTAKKPTTGHNSCPGPQSR